MASRVPRAVIISLSLSTPAPGSAVPERPSVEVPGACQLGCYRARLGGDQARGCPPLCPLRASLSHLTAPPRLPGSCLGLFLLCPMSSPCSPHPPAAQTSTSVRRTASSAGPARCASTPVAATSVWTRRAPPPTGRAPAPGKGQAGWGWGRWGAAGLPGAGRWGTLAPGEPDSSSSRKALSRARGSTLPEFLGAAPELKGNMPSRKALFLQSFGM